MSPNPVPVTGSSIVTAEVAQTYTPAQQAWLNFVDKVRRGEQIDPTGQYVKDGAIIPADAAIRKRPKLDAARDKFPFMLQPDGTIVRLLKANQQGAHTNNYPVDPPCGGDGEPCSGGGGGPVITSTFTTSIGKGGSGGIVDLKVMLDKPTLLGYVQLDADLNKGAGGRYIYFHFTRDPNSVQQGIEYNKGSGYTTSMNVVRFTTANGNFTGQPSTPAYFWPIWSPNQNPNVYWDRIDLNGGAGGAYIYSYQSKDSSVLNPDKTISYYAGIAEIGILSGNSDQIQPPTSWQRYPADLNEGAGGDYIYFCYRN